MNKQSLKKFALGVLCFSFVAAAGTAVAPISASAAPSKVKISQAKAVEADKLIDIAKDMIGEVTYDYGSDNAKTKTFDCSAWVKYVFAQLDISLERSSKAQSKQGTSVDKDNLKPGDLIFFSGTSAGSKEVSHVGIYIGEGKFIHNTSSSKIMGVTITSLDSGKYPERYMSARRVI